MRLELRDGQWAELREYISHADAKEIRRGYVAARDDSDAVWEVQTLTAWKYLKAWHVKDPEGQEIPLDGLESVNRAPDDIVVQISEQAAELLKAASAPNALTPPSSDGSPSGNP